MIFHNHQRKTKRRCVAILYARSDAQLRPLYGSLLRVTRDTLNYLDDAYKVVKNQSDEQAWCAKVRHYRPLILQVMSQTQRRAQARARNSMRCAVCGCRPDMPQILFSRSMEFVVH